MPDASKAAARSTAFDLQHLCRYFSERSSQPMLAVEGENCIVRHVNDAFLRLVGADRSELIGRPFGLAVPEGMINGCAGLLDRVYRTGTPETLAEQKHGDAPPVYWSYSVWPILGEDQRPVGVMIQVADSTETARFRSQSVAINEALVLAGVRQQELVEAADSMNRRLKTAIEEKEYFIAVLSHELRTPLTPVLIAASLLEKNERLDPETREIMRMVHRNVTLEAQLIDDLLQMTRLERGKLALDRRPVNLGDVLERAIETCRPDVEAGELALEVEPVCKPQIVDADANRLQQVFSNLLRNSIKFTPPGGRIHTRCGSDGASCWVEVRDSGAGMDADFLPRAFDAFEQADKGHGRKSGLGLGLAICKTIIDLHGGTITAHSEGKGRGATFVVTLPMIPGEWSLQAEPVSADPPRTVRPLRILLVEDHVDTARLMRLLLMADGHAVESAGDVAGAVKVAAEHTFDLLLSDLGLPDGTGIDLMLSLRLNGSALPGIVLSGYGQDEDIARSRAAGFAAHLVKPINPRALQEAIAGLVGG